MADFAKGITIKEKVFESGTSIINMSIDVTQVMDNPINNDRFINLTIKRGKESGKLYAINNEFYQKNNNKVVDKDDVIVQFEGEEVIPF